MELTKSFTRSIIKNSNANSGFAGARWHGQRFTTKGLGRGEVTCGLAHSGGEGGIG